MGEERREEERGSELAWVGEGRREEAAVAFILLHLLLLRHLPWPRSSLPQEEKGQESFSAEICLTFSGGGCGVWMKKKKGRKEAACFGKMTNSTMTQFAS